VKRTFLFLLGSFLISTAAYSWSAISLGGGNWAIICANGSAWSYSGSSAGLDVVGPALCPGGLVVPNPPTGVKVAKGIDQKVNKNVLKNKQEINETAPSALRTYPPHGYPCLGCVPCPGNPSEFCDVNNNRVLVLSVDGRVPPRMSLLSPVEFETDEE
jgi:hypothetical protein